MVLSLLGSVDCFVIGAVEVFNAFIVIMRLPFTTKSVAAKTIAQMVGGVDYFVIDIAPDLWLWHLRAGDFRP